RSSSLCNVSSRSGGGDASGSSPGPAVAASAARPAGAPGASPRPLAASRHCPRLCAPRRGVRTLGQRGHRRAQRTADAGTLGAVPRDRPGDPRPRRVPSTPPLPGRPEREPERAPSYDSGDAATGERACCLLRCATAAGAWGGPCLAPLSGRPPPPPRAPRARARRLRGRSRREPPAGAEPKMATLLRKIGLIRLHNRDTEDPKHHHNHRGGGQQSASLRGKGGAKSGGHKQQQQQQPQQQQHPGGAGDASPGPGKGKGKRAAELAPRDKAPAAAAAAAAAGAGGPRERAAGARAGPGPAVAEAAGGSLVPAARQQHCTQVRSRRLMKELQDIARLSDRFISVELVDESLFDWNVKLHQVDKDSVLWQDMKETNTEFILLNLTFPDNFPFSPPFMRVLSPRLENGYVLDGGAICMELLTPRGWSSAYTVEAVMRQFAASLVKGQGRICRKAGKSKKSFSRKEAEATFKSLVKTHEKYGWVTPPVSDG
ncbi:hypothetical protein H8959_021984, partial [Pygathrix nigripes]